MAHPFIQKLLPNIDFWWKIASISNCFRILASSTQSLFCWYSLLKNAKFCSISLRGSLYLWRIFRKKGGREIKAKANPKILRNFLSKCAKIHNFLFLFIFFEFLSILLKIIMKQNFSVLISLFIVCTHSVVNYILFVAIKFHSIFSLMSVNQFVLLFLCFFFFWFREK